MTTADSSMLLQTVIKNKASYIEEIQRDMRLQIRQSKKLIFIGYSLPSDDVEYQSIFAAESDKDHPKKVFLVLFKKGAENRWLSVKEALASLNKEDDTFKSIERYAKLFGKQNVQVNLAGFPDASDAILQVL